MIREYPFEFHLKDLRFPVEAAFIQGQRGIDQLRELATCEPASAR
jgi:hypothetical protein